MAKRLNKADLSGLNGAALEEAALGNWVALNRVLRCLNRQQVAWLLLREFNGQKRELFIKRLHQRFSTLRQRDEASYLMRVVDPPDWLNGELQ